MKKILIVFGTRPEAIKMAPVVREFKKQSLDFTVKVCVTAQHRHMLDQVLNFFAIEPDYDLNLMTKDQTLNALTGKILVGMDDILKSFKPDFVFVHGDTTTSMATSLASFHHGAKVCHVEAGLRTHKKLVPFPEEMNRVITGRIADYHFAPTEQARQNLLDENVPAGNIVVTGNTVIDALFLGLKQMSDTLASNPAIRELKQKLKPELPIILVTGHRRENFGDGFTNICNSLKSIAKSNKAQIVYPVHLNPNVKEPVNDILTNLDNVLLIEPMAYPEFIWLLSKSKIVLTDSGGIQEEAPSLGKPVLVLREVTERPEAVEAGTVILVGTNQKKIVHETLELLTNEKKYLTMSKLHNPYGDGTASRRILEFMRNIT